MIARSSAAKLVSRPDRHRVNVQVSALQRSNRFNINTRVGLSFTLLGLILIGSAGAFAWYYRASLADLINFGYPGLFVLMILSASAYFPVPGPPTVALAGALLNPWLVGLVAGLGNSVGEMSSFLLGKGAGETLHEVRQRALFVTVERWLRQRGFITVLVLAAVPNPVFHAVTLTSAGMGFPARRFWLACAIGNVIKYTVLALTGWGRASGCACSASARRW